MRLADEIERRGLQSHPAGEEEGNDASRDLTAELPPAGMASSGSFELSPIERAWGVDCFS
jgi:hypothetical protein